MMGDAPEEPGVEFSSQVCDGSVGPVLGLKGRVHLTKGVEMSGGSKERMDGVLVDNLALGQSPTEAAEGAGVSRATAYRRLEDPKFREQVIQRRATLVDELTSRVTEAANGAVARIQLLMLDSQSEQIQLRAARTILDQMVRLRDIVEFESRIRKVEVQARQLAKEREEELPRVCGRTRKQAIFEQIERVQKRLTKPGISDEHRQNYEEQIRVMTLAWESC